MLASAENRQRRRKRRINVMAKDVAIENENNGRRAAARNQLASEGKAVMAAMAQP
jgi:hypothetical protein